MTSAIFTNGQPWTESEFLELGETPERIELFDGSLHVTPAPTRRHQYISGELFVILRTSARQVGLHVFTTVNVRLKPNRVPIPDLVITTDGTDGLITDATTIKLVCEITSPSNAATDRVLKMHYYAAAGIPWYLLVEHDTGTLRLHRLEGDKYLEHSVTEVGETLQLTEPVVATIKPAELLLPQ
ncbi:MAG: Uma2 family endonuclease [Actinoplanes sp.]